MSAQSESVLHSEPVGSGAPARAGGAVVPVVGGGVALRGDAVGGVAVMGGGVSACEGPGGTSVESGPDARPRALAAAEALLRQGARAAVVTADAAGAGAARAAR